jgi:hypothetical protein
MTSTLPECIEIERFNIHPVETDTFKKYEILNTFADTG